MEDFAVGDKWSIRLSTDFEATGVKSVPYFRSFKAVTSTIRGKRTEGKRPVPMLPINGWGASRANRMIGDLGTAGNGAVFVTWFSVLGRIQSVLSSHLNHFIFISCTPCFRWTPLEEFQIFYSKDVFHTSKDTSRQESVFICTYRPFYSALLSETRSSWMAEQFDPSTCSYLLCLVWVDWWRLWKITKLGCHPRAITLHTRRRCIEVYSVRNRRCDSLLVRLQVYWPELCDQ